LFTGFVLKGGSSVQPSVQVVGGADQGEMGERLFYRGLSLSVEFACAKKTRIHSIFLY